MLPVISLSLEYIDPRTALKLFKDVEIGYIKPLFIGAMNDALNYKIGFDSKIPGLLGYPEPPKGKERFETLPVIFLS